MIFFHPAGVVAHALNLLGHPALCGLIALRLKHLCLNDRGAMLRLKLQGSVEELVCCERRDFHLIDETRWRNRGIVSPRRLVDNWFQDDFIAARLVRKFAAVMLPFLS